MTVLLSYQTQPYFTDLMKMHLCNLAYKTVLPGIHLKVQAPFQIYSTRKRELQTVIAYST